MSWFSEQITRARLILRRRGRFDDDLAEEMRLHLDLRAAEDPAAARATRIRFGNVSRIQEDSRAAWGWPTLESIVQDVRYGIRTLAASPAFTLTAIVSLTLGIGANTAIFSLLNAIMLRTLPVKDPVRLVKVEQGDAGPSFTNPLWEQVRDRAAAAAFDGAFAYGNSQFDLSDGGERHLAAGLMVSGDYFRTLGVPAIRGRVITPVDDKRGCGSDGPVAVISYRFWQGRFGGDPSIIGRTLTLNRVRFQIAGVTPAWFTGLSKDTQYDVAVPIGCEPLFATDRSALDQRSWWWLAVVARLKPGATVQSTAAQLAALSPGIMESTLPTDWKADMKKRYLARKLTLAPAATGFSGLGRTYGKALFTLQVVVAIVLLIACANVANLLLARSTARQREMSVRLAIGAGRGRIVRQLLTESVLLATAGAAGGLILASWGTRLLVHMLNTADTVGGAKPFEIELDTSLDLTVIAFTAAIVVLTTLFFGLLPALRASAAAPAAVLKEQGRGSVAGGTRRLTLANAMVALQIGLALTLLSAAALFGESFRRILSIDPGFNAHNLVLAHVDVPQALLAKPLRTRTFDEALDRLRRIPGVESASRADLTPIGNMVWNEDVYPEGYQSANQDDRLVYFNRISPGYLKTMGTKLIAGRDFDERDKPDSPLVMIIGQSTARGFWGSANPIGRTIGVDSDRVKGTQDSYQVIGVVEDIKYETLSEKQLKTGFFPTSQESDPRNATTYELRLASMGTIHSVLPLARAALLETDKNFSLEFQTYAAQISDSLIQPRLIAAVSGFFGLVALILAATGLYGVVAYSTARRKAEFGLRMALGATPGRVLLIVLRDTGLTLAAGAVLGLTAAQLAGRFVRSLVFAVKPTDPAILGAALAVLVATAAIAAYVPARRASRQDPIESLRVE